MSASAFKTLYTQMIQNGGDYNALPKDLLKKDLQVFVKETKPYFLVSDSFFYVPAYFTQAAITEYQSKFPQVNVLDLENKVIVITKWSLELRRVNSTEVFTSYAGVECRLIVHSFKPQLKESLHPTRHPTNLYRDDEFKTTIQAFRHGQVVAAAAASKKVEMAPITGGKGQVSQGILANSCGQWQFKEGNTKVVSLGAGKKSSQGAASAVKSKGGKKVTKKVAKASGKAVAAVDSLMSGAQKTKSGKKSTGKKSTTSKPPATPDAGKRTGSTSNMTVAQYRAYLQQVKKLKKK